MAAALAALPAALSPALLDDYEALYRQAVEELNQHLAAPDSTEVRVMLRSLIERVVVQSGERKGGKCRPIQLHGNLYGLLDGADMTTPGLFRDRAIVTPLVAGTGFEPVTFRL